MRAYAKSLLQAVDQDQHTPLEIPFCDCCSSIMPEALRRTAAGEDLDGLLCTACERDPAARHARKACDHQFEVQWWQLRASRFMYAKCSCCGLQEPYRPGAGFMGTPALSMPGEPRNRRAAGGG